MARVDAAKIAQPGESHGGAPFLLAPLFLGCRELLRASPGEHRRRA
ncbi:hypothetical protein [Nocardiopsis sp. CNR-923]|nr:hypothetical protein [Nocardiopsis sp. CNR-923]